MASFTQLVHGELGKALDANFLTPLVACALIAWAVTGVRLETRRHVILAAACFAGLSMLVNLVHPLPRAAGGLRYDGRSRLHAR